MIKFSIFSMFTLPGNFPQFHTVGECSKRSSEKMASYSQWGFLFSLSSIKYIFFSNILSSKTNTKQGKKGEKIIKKRRILFVEEKLKELKWKLTSIEKAVLVKAVKIRLIEHLSRNNQLMIKEKTIQKNEIFHIDNEKILIQT